MTGKEIKKIMKDNIWDVQEAKCCLSMLDLVFYFYAQAGLNPMFAYFNFADCSMRQIIRNEDLVRKSDKLYADFLKDKASLKAMFDQHARLTAGIDGLWKEYELIGPKNIQAAVDILEGIVKLMRKWWFYAAVGEDKGEVIARRIVPYFAKRFQKSPSEAREMVLALAHPGERSAFTLEHEGFLRLCLDFAAKKNISMGIKKYQRDFFWFKTDFYQAHIIDKESLLSDIKKKLKEKGESGVRMELLRSKSTFQKIEKDKRNILGKIKLNKTDKLNIEFASEIIRWIDWRKVGTMKQCYYVFRIIDDIAFKIGVSYNDLINLRYKETIYLMRNNAKTRSSIFGKKNGSILVLFRKGMKKEAVFDEKADDILALALSSRSEVVQGTVASSGKIGNLFTGRARVINDPNTADFSEGDILVTSMTRVEYVPLMRKAKAVITNEGGVASHAAIVSRELGIPAIIGTKNATKVLHDGDLVEVDINNGRVKIINEKKYEKI